MEVEYRGTDLQRRSIKSSTILYRLHKNIPLVCRILNPEDEGVITILCPSILLTSNAC